jgi:P-type Ca2+ transporter type 2C
VQIDGAPVTDPVLLDEVRFVLGGGSLANDASLHQGPDGWSVLGDPTEAAFLVAEAKIAGLTDVREARFERVGEIPFSSDRKLMTTLQADVQREGRIAVVTKGAPDVLLARCTRERVAGQVRELTDARRARSSATSSGWRISRCARSAWRTGRSRSPNRRRHTVEQELVYLGTVGIIDPPRDEAVTAIEQAHAAGVRIIMITGDHPRTASRIAADLGIATADGPVLAGPEIEAMPQDELVAAATGDLRVRAGRTGTQAADRRRPAGRRADRGHDR